MTSSRLHEIIQAIDSAEYAINTYASIIPKSLASELIIAVRDANAEIGEGEIT